MIDTSTSNAIVCLVCLQHKLNVRTISYHLNHPTLIAESAATPFCYLDVIFLSTPKDSLAT